MMMMMMIMMIIDTQLFLIVIESSLFTNLIFVVPGGNRCASIIDSLSTLLCLYLHRHQHKAAATELVRKAICAYCRPNKLPCTMSK